MQISNFTTYWKKKNDFSFDIYTNRIYLWKILKWMVNILIFIIFILFIVEHNFWLTMKFYINKKSNMKFL